MEETTVDDLVKAGNEASGQARNTWISFILFGAYLAVAVGATTHRQLLLEAPIDLPLLSVKLPLVAFYRLVPILFVLVHFYVLVQLYLLSRTLHLLNDAVAAIPLSGERERIRVRLDSFIMMQLISGLSRDWLPRLFVRLAAWVTLLAAPVLLLLAFQVQFLAYHDETTTWIHRFALVLDLVLTWVLWPAIVDSSGRFGGAVARWVRGLVVLPAQAAAKTIELISSLRAGGPAWPSLRDAWRTYTTVEQVRDAVNSAIRQVTALAVLLTVCGGIVVFSLLIATVPGESIEAWWTGEWVQTPLRLEELPAECGNRESASAEIETSATSPATEAHRIRTLACLSHPVVWTHRAAGYRRQINRRIGLTWWPTVILFEGVPDPVESTVDSWLSRNLVLIDVDLIGLDSDKLAKTERTIVLRGRDLRNAVLDRTDLRKADLSGAHLEGASLVATKLTATNLTKAKLAHAWLMRASLQGAILDSADLQGADLEKAELQGATLESAQLQGANLTEATFWGASLKSAFLTTANLRSAALQGTELRGADLRGAALDSAGLQGADLGPAKLDGAELTSASVWRATTDLRPITDLISRYTDARFLDLKPLQVTGMTVEQAIGRWLATIPEGTARTAAEMRLSGLRDPSSEQKGRIERSGAWWADLKSQSEALDMVTDAPLRAAFLAGLGCHTDARGLLIRLKSTQAPPYAPCLAAALLDGNCRAADGLAAGEKKPLKGLADGAFNCAAVDPQTSSTPP